MSGTQTICDLQRELANAGENLKVVWTGAYIRRSDGCVLVRKRLHGTLDAGKWGPPGGKVERGETIIAGLRRELLEETGMRAVGHYLLDVYDHGRGVCFFYRVISHPRDIPRTESGHHPWQWVDPEHVTTANTQGGLAAWLGCGTPGCVSLLGDRAFRNSEVL